jgi:hypothetical protein
MGNGVASVKGVSCGLPLCQSYSARQGRGDGRLPRGALDVDGASCPVVSQPRCFAASNSPRCRFCLSEAAQSRERVQDDSGPASERRYLHCRYLQLTNRCKSSHNLATRSWAVTFAAGHFASAESSGNLRQAIQLCCAAMSGKNLQILKIFSEIWKYISERIRRSWLSLMGSRLFCPSCCLAPAERAGDDTAGNEAGAAPRSPRAGSRPRPPAHALACGELPSTEQWGRQPASRSIEKRHRSTLNGAGVRSNIFLNFRRRPGCVEKIFRHKILLIKFCVGKHKSAKSRSLFCFTSRL